MTKKKSFVILDVASPFPIAHRVRSWETCVCIQIFYLWSWCYPNHEVQGILHTICSSCDWNRETILAIWCFPIGMETAVIKPLLKKELKNYRPVSNLAFLSKILEKAALNQIKSLLKLTLCYQTIKVHIGNTTEWKQQWLRCIMTCWITLTTTKLP